MGARREQVLEAAMALVVERGTHGLTHRKVDARAGVPAGTTSNHFPTRLALARAVLREIIVTDAEFQRRQPEYDERLTGEELMLAWLRRRAEHVLGPWRLHALTWYRFIVDGSADPEIRAEVAEVRKQVFHDTEVIIARCGSSDVPRHTAMLRSFVGGVLLTQHINPVDTDDLDRLLLPMVRGLMHTIRRDAEVGVGTP